MWYFRENPEYDYYWLMEYDVRFSGHWMVFFRHFANSSSHLLATTLFDHDFRPGWEHWKTLKSPQDVPHRERVRALLPLYRLSNPALQVLHQAYCEGWSGHYEVTTPTILKTSGFSLEDFGGSGSYVAEGNYNRFYRNSPGIPGLAPGTFTYAANQISAAYPPNLLWHPVKEPVRVNPSDSRRPISVATFARFAAFAAVAIGVILRLVQFFARPSLWVDEAAMARNVLDRNMYALLLSPLSYGQVAPPGFLAAVKACSLVFGVGELSLRLVPVLSGVLAVPLFYLLARRHLGQFTTATATLAMSIATPLVLFSANLKPYATDVLATIAIVLVAEEMVDAVWDKPLTIALAIGGLVVPMFSSAAVFALVPAGEIGR